MSDNLHVLRGFAECGEDQAWRERATVRQQMCQGPLEERVKGRAGASARMNTRSHTGFFSNPEPFTGGRVAQSLFFKLLGLKSGFIFTLASQPVCSSEPRRCRPELWVLYCN